MADLGDVHEAFDARSELDERAERHELGHAASDGRARLDSLHRGHARIGDELLHAEADLRRGLREVELDDLHGDDLADLHDVSGALHALVREIRNVDQAIDAADVGKRAVALNRGDGRRARLADFQHREQLFTLFRALDRDHGLAAHDQTVLVLVELDDLHRELLADEDGDVRDVAHIDLTRRHERAVMRDLHLESALVHAGAATFDGLSDLERAPVGLLHNAFEAEDRETLKRIEALDDESTLAADDRRLLVARGEELRERANALRARAELDKHIARVHADDGALARLTPASALPAAGRRARSLEILDRHAAKRGFDLALKFGVVGACARGGDGLIVLRWFGGHVWSRAEQRTSTLRS